MEGNEAIARTEAGKETTTRGNGAGRILSAKTLQHGRVDTGNGENRILMACSSIVSKYFGLHLCTYYLCTYVSQCICCLRARAYCPNCVFPNCVLSGSRSPVQILVGCVSWSRVEGHCIKYGWTQSTGTQDTHKYRTQPHSLKQKLFAPPCVEVLQIFADDGKSMR